jgi:DNA-binding transcriptional LysR family regulator
VRSDLHRFVTNGFREAALPVPAIQEVSGSARVAGLVSVGMGVGLLTSAVKPQLPDGLVARPIADLAIRYRLAIAWCPESKRSGVVALAAIARDSQLFSNLNNVAMPARHQR